MVSEKDEKALVKMFCAYCRRTLRNARTDIARAKSRQATREVLFSDLGERELNQLAITSDSRSEQVVFEVIGREVVVLDARLAQAIARLTEEERTVILLYYFAGWTDKHIAYYLGCARSTVQFRRAKAPKRLRVYLEEGGENGL